MEVLGVTSHNFTVEWAPPPDHTHNGIIRSYLLNISELDTGRIFVRRTTELLLVVEHLHPYYTYMFTVAAVTVRAGPPSDALVITTFETG